MNPTPLARILIVDDEVANMRALCDTLRDQGYDPEGAASGEEALKLLRGSQFDLLLTDLMMPGMDGVALLTQALKIDSQLVGILMTGKGTIETAVEAMKAGALDFVLKPIRLGAIQPVLARAVSVRRLRLENLELRNTVAIHELNQAIAHTLDPNVLLDKIAEAALAQFEADEASVMLLSEDGAFLYVAAVRGEHRDALLGARLPVGEGIAGTVAVRREPLVLEGEVKDPGLAPQFPRAEIRSSLSMPMITRGKLIGVLNVNCTRRTGAFSLGQVKVLSIFTNAAAAGIEAANLYENERRADARYRHVLDLAADAIVSLDERREITVFNAAAERIFGWPAAEILGKPLDVLVPSRLVEAHRHHIEAFDASPETTIPMQGRRPFPARRKDGTEFQAEISISRGREGGRNVYTSVVRDVTQRLQQEEKIARLSRIQAVLSGINSAIVRIRDREELFREACRIAVDAGKFRMAWIGLAEPDLLKAKPVAWQGVVDGYLDEVGQALEGSAEDRGAGGRALRDKRPIVFNDTENNPDIAYRREALARGYRSLAVLPLLVNDTPAGVIALYAAEAGMFDQEEMRLLEELAGDVSFALEVMDKESKIAFLANHNPVTGLPNRALFEELLRQRMRRARRDGKVLAVILLGLSRFTQVNATFGRHVGDDVMRQVGQRLTEAFGDDKVVSHIGGDDFALATSIREVESDLAHIAEQVIETVFARAFKVDHSEVQLDARAGIAVYPADGEDEEGLVRNAEAALKEAKRSGQRYQFYARRMNEAMAQTLHLENRLRRALEREEFVLHYQPKVDLGTGTVTGLEALIRWQDPERGMVPPGKFIPLLEETGLILEVGRWAMHRAVRDAAALRAKLGSAVRIAVNVSPVQLRQKDFLDSVEAALGEAGGAQHGLDIEITEGVVMHDIDASVRILGQLRDMKVELAIDDFGTGYSSLAYVARLPIGSIKIDRAFIHDLAPDSTSYPIVYSIISMSHALGRKVIAEGVETERQAELLRLLRCDQYQGYLFSRPVPITELEQILARRPAP